MIAYELAIYVGLLLGSFSSGYVYEATDAYMVFSISAISIFVALFLMIVILPESLPIESRTSTSSTTQRGLVSFLKDLWNTCQKPREHNNRSIVLIIMVVLLLTAFVSGTVKINKNSLIFII